MVELPRTHSKLSCRPDSPSSKVVRGGSVWSDHPELTRNYPVGLIPLAAKWFEEVRRSCILIGLFCIQSECADLAGLLWILHSRSDPPLFYVTTGSSCFSFIMCVRMPPVVACLLIECRPAIVP